MQDLKIDFTIRKFINKKRKTKTNNENNTLHDIICNLLQKKQNTFQNRRKFAKKKKTKTKT
jgi:hypothetical protein